jgi:hypothetical protein
MIQITEEEVSKTIEKLVLDPSCQDHCQDHTCDTCQVARAVKASSVVTELVTIQMMLAVVSGDPARAMRGLVAMGIEVGINIRSAQLLEEVLGKK